VLWLNQAARDTGRPGKMGKSIWRKSAQGFLDPKVICGLLRVSVCLSPLALVHTACSEQIALGVARLGLRNCRQTDLTIFDCSLRRSATHALILAASCFLPFCS
jgi:hypothetical protein